MHSNHFTLKTTSPFKASYLLNHSHILPEQTGRGLLQVPSLQVMMLTPFSLKPLRQPNVTFFPCLKSPPLLKPFDRAPGSAQFSVQKMKLAST